MSLRDRLDELNVVELPLLCQLGAMGWTHIAGAQEDTASGHKKFHLLGRSDFQKTLLRDRLEAVLRRLNRNDDGSEWLDDRRINQAISHLERPTAKDFIAINEELHEKSSAASMSQARTVSANALFVSSASSPVTPTSSSS